WPRPGAECLPEPQFPELRTRRGQGRRRDQSGQALAWPLARRAQGRTRLPLFLAALWPGSGRNPRRHRHCRATRRQDFGDTAAHGPDRLRCERPDRQRAGQGASQESGLTMDEAERERFAAFLLRMRGAGLDRRDLMAAVEATPRASFVPPQWRADAWSDRSLPIECGETIEGIDLQMRAISMLSLEPGSRVLEIGTGSGFTSAVMARLSARVLSLDRFRTLCEAARTRHETLGLSNILIRQADGSQGAPAEGPF